jgi:cytidine deaminase
MAITTENEKHLIDLARKVSEKSYSPYSNFPVGCAILDEKGNTYAGCNVENASIGLSICAERNAIFHAISQVGKGLKVDLVVVYTPTSTPTTPCGACRQVIQEFADNPEIICACDGEEVLITNLNDLFPQPPRIT